MRYEFVVPGDDHTVDYELVEIPFDPTLLTRARPGGKERSDVEHAARWLSQTLPRRLRAAQELLRALGAPQVDGSDPRSSLLELGRWLQEWFHEVAKPYVETSYPSEPGWKKNWLQPMGNDRLGQVVAWWPHQACYSEMGDRLLHSLVVDLTAVVVDAAAPFGPPPAWSVEKADQWFLIVARPSVPPFGPLSQVWELLVQASGPARGERGRALRRRQSEILADSFDQLVTGASPAKLEALYPENRWRSRSRFDLQRPARSVPPADPAVLERVVALRQIGFYESWRHSDDDLATGLSVAWERATGRALPTQSTELWLALILVDADRTWFEDIDVQILDAHDQMYREVLFALQKIGGRGFGGFSDPEEDWRSSPDTVTVTVRWRRKTRRFRLPKTPDRIIEPTLFVELNALLPDDGPRLRFLDIGPTVPVVLRLTDDEESQLHEATGLEILIHPPAWWGQAAQAGLASLPSGRADPLLMGARLDQPSQTPEPATLTPDSDDLRAVSVTDCEEDGEIVFSVFVSAAEFLRGGAVETALEDRVTAAIGSQAGVETVVRSDREVWEVTGRPNEGDLLASVQAAVGSVLSEYEDDISALFAGTEGL